MSMIARYIELNRSKDPCLYEILELMLEEIHGLRREVQEMRAADEVRRRRLKPAKRLPPAKA